MIFTSLEIFIVTITLFRSLLDQIARNFGYATPEEVRQCVRSAEEEALRSLAHNNKEPNATGPSKVSFEAPRASGALRYFVAYHYTDPSRVNGFGSGGNGFGCMEIERTHPVSTFEEVQKMGSFIQDVLDPNGKKGVKVCVLNWTPFEKILPEPGDKEPPQEENKIVQRAVV